MPFLEGMHDCKHFMVIDLVVVFCQGQGSEEKCYCLPFPILFLG